MQRKFRVLVAAVAAACVGSFALAQPVNDLCSNATNVGEGVFPFTTVNALANGPGPTCRVGGPVPTRDVFFRYTASVSGPVTVSTCGTDETVLTLLLQCDGLQLACDQGGCQPAAGSRLSFNAVAGGSVIIRVANWSANPPATVSGNLVIASGAVPNDTCANATNVGEGTFPFSTGAATANGPAASCRFDGPQVTNDVFFRYTPSQTGQVTISTCGAGDTTLSVLSACGGTQIACDDDACVVGSSSRLTLNVTIGSAVIIRVANWSPSPSSSTAGNLVIEGVPPANDLCANATDIAEGSIDFTTDFATANGPAASCRPGGPEVTKDVFFRYSPSTTGPVRVSLISAGDLTLSLLSACGGSELACDDNADFSAQIDFAAVLGTPVIIRVANVPSSAFVRFFGTLQVQGLAPANDACASATQIGEGAFPFSTAFAFADGPAASCRANGPQTTNDVFFRYTPSATGPVVVSTCGAGDTTLSVLSACAGFAIACDDDSCTQPTEFSSRLTFSAVAGSPVIIRVANYAVQANVGLSGTLVVQNFAPVNDLCVSATNIAEGAFPFTTESASANGPAASCRATGPVVTKDVFFRYTPTSTGLVEVSTCGVGDTTLSVLSDCSGTELACDDDTCGFGTDYSSRLTFSAVAGTPVIIRVANWDPDSATVLSGTLVVQPVPPANDLCVNATDITEGTFPFSTQNASANGPAASCRVEGPVVTRDVFFRYLPTSTGLVEVSTCGAGDTTLSVLSECSGTELACDDDACGVANNFSSRLTFGAVAGTPVIIRVANWNTITSVFIEGNLVVSPVTVGCDSVDFNNDGVFPDDQDLTDFIFVLGGGACPTCNDVDFNNDDVFPDDSDLVTFLFVLGGGAC